MSTMPLKDCTGKELGELTLSDRFDTGGKGDHSVYQAVVVYEAARHQGSASTLRKGEVSGSGAKPWRQKGLGRARAGYTQSNIWRGGAKAFGPHPRKPRKKMPRRAARQAFAHAFAAKAADGALLGLDSLTLEAPRTKEFRKLLAALDLDGRLLVVIDEPDTNVFLAARNLPEVEVVCADNVNTWQIVRYPRIVVTRAALEKIEQRLA